MHIYNAWKRKLQSFRMIHEKMLEELRTQGLYTKGLLKLQKEIKVVKNYRAIKPKSYSQLQIMRKMPAKFQGDSWKAVWGLAHTRYVPKGHSDSEKRLSKQSKKKKVRKFIHDDP